jgi:hypothetical protein
MNIFKKTDLNKAHKWRYKKPRETDIFIYRDQGHVNCNCISAGVL